VQVITTNDSINHNKGRKKRLFIWNEMFFFIEENHVEEMDVNVS
jgi:hypothetical protein